MLISKINHTIQTILPNRYKRGLLNIGGKAMNWLYRVMDSDDREEVEEHLKVINSNNYNAISNLNAQIKINSNLKILTEKINENRKLMLKFYNSINTIDRTSDLKIIQDEIEKIQDNIIFAKHGTVSRSILTEEIDFYKIGFSKLQQLKCLLGNINKTLFFVILIPVFSENTFMNYKLVSVSSKNHEEVAIKQTDVVMYNKQVFLKNEDNYIYKKLKNQTIVFVTC